MFLFAGYRQTLKPQQPTEISPDDSGGDWFMSMYQKFGEGVAICQLHGHFYIVREH